MDASEVSEAGNPTGHFVQFYQEEGALLAEVSRYFGMALRTGHTGIVIARPILDLESGSGFKSICQAHSRVIQPF